MAIELRFSDEEMAYLCGYSITPGIDNVMNQSVKGNHDSLIHRLIQKTCFFRSAHGTEIDLESFSVTMTILEHL